MKKSPSPPQEDPSVKVFRERQIQDLAKLDEEENRRLKAAFQFRRGVRAFRPSGRSGGGSTTSVAVGGGLRGSGGGGRGGVER